ncbi:hypothetical protein C0995_009562, partial [Termitomyces sp. Mi166
TTDKDQLISTLDERPPLSRDNTEPPISTCPERTTTKRELWSYYLYYVGFNFGPSQFQNLLFLAGYDPTTHEPFALPCNDNGCVLPYFGKRSASLLDGWESINPTNGAQELHSTSLDCSLTFWTAAFPGLARCLPEVQRSLSEVKAGNKSLESHANYESLSRNHVSNISFTICSVGEVIILAVMVGILKALKSDESTENNTKAFSVLIAFSGGVCTVITTLQNSVVAYSTVQLTLLLIVGLVAQAIGI